MLKDQFVVATTVVDEEVPHYGSESSVRTQLHDDEFLLQHATHAAVNVVHQS
jgi:hypothetical protein